MGQKDDERDLSPEVAKAISDLGDETDPRKWAEEFARLSRARGVQSLDTALLMVFFQNAMLVAVHVDRQALLSEEATREIPIQIEGAITPLSGELRQLCLLEGGRLEGMARMLRIIGEVNYNNLAEEMEAMAKRLRGEAPPPRGPDSAKIMPCGR